MLTAFVDVQMRCSAKLVFLNSYKKPNSVFIGGSVFPLKYCRNLLCPEAGIQVHIPLDSFRNLVSMLFSSSRESSSMSWEIAEVSLSDEGFYECLAMSSAGTGRAQTFLDVSGGSLSVLLCWNVIIHCAGKLHRDKWHLRPRNYTVSSKCIFN